MQSAVSPALASFCLLRRRPAQNGCCAAGLENVVAPSLSGMYGAKTALSRVCCRQKTTQHLHIAPQARQQTSQLQMPFVPSFNGPLP
jgi:hypothetical protein